MKKINFISLPSYFISVVKTPDDIFIKRNHDKKLYFKKIKFQSWCNSININRQKLIIKVMAKSEQL